MTLQKKPRDQIIEKLRPFESIFSSDLLKAEYFATLKREGVPFEDKIINYISFIVPKDSLDARQSRLAERVGFPLVTLTTT